MPQLTAPGLKNTFPNTTVVRATTIKSGFAMTPDEPQPRPRFSWGFKNIAITDKQRVKSRETLKRDPEPAAPATKAAVTFHAQIKESPAPPRDSVTRLSTRVTGNTQQMYSSDEYPAAVRRRASSSRSSLSRPAARPRPAPRCNSAEERDAAENFRPLHFGERMLRNTAVCVAILLCAIAIKTVDAPIAQTVSSELRDWVTMDLDESLGSLKFVQNLMPDAALVFWHIGSKQTFSTPSQAALSHSWNESEPYLTYASDLQNPVYAAAQGEVTDITYLEDNTATIRLRHDDGMETVYGNLASCTVREGELVNVSQIIGASSTLYFEIRGEGRSMNPAPLMAERQP